MIRAFEHSHGMSSTTDSDRKFCSQRSSFSEAVFLMAMKAFIEMSLAVMIMDLDFLIIDLLFFSLPPTGPRVKASDWSTNLLRLSSSSSSLYLLLLYFSSFSSFLLFLESLPASLLITRIFLSTPLVTASSLMAPTAAGSLSISSSASTTCALPMNLASPMACLSIDTTSSSVSSPRPPSLSSCDMSPSNWRWHPSSTVRTTALCNKSAAFMLEDSLSSSDRFLSTSCKKLGFFSAMSLKASCSGSLLPIMLTSFSMTAFSPPRACSVAPDESLSSSASISLLLHLPSETAATLAKKEPFSPGSSSLAMSSSSLMSATTFFETTPSSSKRPLTVSSTQPSRIALKAVSSRQEWSGQHSLSAPGTEQVMMPAIRFIMSSVSVAPGCFSSKCFLSASRAGFSLLLPWISSDSNFSFNFPWMKASAAPPSDSSSRSAHRSDMTARKEALMILLAAGES